jgi:hypothetical protein
MKEHQIITIVICGGLGIMWFMIKTAGTKRKAFKKMIERYIK